MELKKRHGSVCRSREDEIDFEEAGLYQPPMTDLDRDEALKMFDSGERQYFW